MAFLMLAAVIPATCGVFNFQYQNRLAETNSKIQQKDSVIQEMQSRIKELESAAQKNQQPENRVGLMFQPANPHVGQLTSLRPSMAGLTPSVPVLYWSGPAGLPHYPTGFDGVNWTPCEVGEFIIIVQAIRMVNEVAIEIAKNEFSVSVLIGDGEGQC